MPIPSRKQLLTWLLTPLSWIYGGITAVRNWMFDNNLLAQTEYDVPVVSVGNITVGGTGKTPHVEYILGALASDYNIGVLSRGYKRKTKGFLVANCNSTPDSVGDEPLQIYHKYGMRVKVAVCENRRKGITELLKEYPEINLIVLDDAFQHRYVKPKVSILLTDHHRPIYRDHLLPLGRLRENWKQVERADMVVVTKCPETLTPWDRREICKNLNPNPDYTPHNLTPRPYQSLHFSSIQYGGLLPAFPDDDPYSVYLGNLTEKDTVLLVTGIANPRSFVRYFRSYPFKVVVAHFPDHHDFTRRDLIELRNKFDTLTGARKMIVTTEKDAVRLSYNPYVPHELKPLIFYLPIKVQMLPRTEDETSFIDDLRKRINE